MEKMEKFEPAGICPLIPPKCSKCRYVANGINHGCDYMEITGRARIVVSPGVVNLGIGEDCHRFEPSTGQRERKMTALTIMPNAGSRPEEAQGVWKKRYEQMRQLYREGMNDKQISREIRCSPVTVRAWRLREGLPSHGGVQTNAADVAERRHQMQVLYDQGLLDREIAEKMHLARRTVQKWRREAKLPSHYKGGKNSADD